MNSYQEVRIYCSQSIFATYFAFLALVLPVGMRKFSTNINTEVVYRWTNGFEGYRDLPGAATCNPNATQSGKSPIYLDDTGDTRANAGFYSC